METVEEKIHLALKELSKGLNYPVAYPAEGFTPGNAYIRFGEVHTDPARIMIDDGRPYMRSGFLMMTFAGKIINGVPSESYVRQAGLIAQHFKDSVKIRYMGICVTIYNAPTLLTAYETDGYWNIPVRIPWRCFA